MDLQHNFSVPASIDDTWAAFNDLQRIGGCLPGATITSVDGDDFTGTVKVKLGPISLQYNGTGSYTERDEAAHRVVILAKGKDKRGNGTASATITAVLTADGSGTAVAVDTDLAITGKPAQFGRGVIQDVSDQLLGQFVDCIKGKLTPESPVPVSTPPESPAPADPAGDFPPDDSPLPAPGTDALAESELPTVKPPSDEATRPAEPGPAATPSGSASPDGASPKEAPEPEQKTAPTTGPKTAPKTAAEPIAGPPAAEIDLMSTVGPVLVKRYAKPAGIAVAAVIVLALLRKLFGSRS